MLVNCGHSWSRARGSISEKKGERGQNCRCVPGMFFRERLPGLWDSAEMLLPTAPPPVDRGLWGSPSHLQFPSQSLCLPLGTSLSFQLYLYQRLPFYPVSSILSISEGAGFLVAYTDRHRSAWIALQKVLNLYWVRKAKEARSVPAGILTSQTWPSITLSPAPHHGSRVTVVPAPAWAGNHWLLWASPVR